MAIPGFKDFFKQPACAEDAEPKRFGNVSSLTVYGENRLDFTVKESIASSQQEEYVDPETGDFVIVLMVYGRLEPLVASSPPCPSSTK